MPPHWYSGESPFWRFIVSDLNGHTLTCLDKLASSRALNFVLNGPAMAEGFVPSDAEPIWELHDDGYPFLNEGNRLLYGFRREIAPNGIDPQWVCRYAGRIELVEDASRTNDAQTHYTAYDPWRYWHNLYFSHDEGNSSYYDLDMVFTRYTAAQIIRMLFGAPIVSNGYYNTFPNIHVLDPDGYTGTMPLHVLYDVGGVPSALIDDAFDGDNIIDSITIPRNTSLGEALLMICSTGACDITLTPMWDPINWPGVTHVMNVVNKAGTDRFNAVFSWDVPPRSVVQVSHLFDGTARANEIINTYENAGNTLELQLSNITLDQDSIDVYGNYTVVESLTGLGGAWGPWVARSLAMTELELRKDGKRTITVGPVPERSPRAFQEWYLGDVVSVYASRNLREAISDQYRIYGLPVSLSDNGLEKIEQLIVASDQYAAPVVEAAGASGSGANQAVFVNRRPRRVRPSTSLRGD